MILVTSGEKEGPNFLHLIESVRETIYPELSLKASSWLPNIYRTN